MMEKFQIPTVPTAMYYIPDFIAKDEESVILQKVATLHPDIHFHVVQRD